MCELYIYDGLIYKSKNCNYNDISEAMVKFDCDEILNIGDLVFITRYNDTIVLIEKLPDRDDDNFGNALDHAENNGRNFITNTFENIDKKKIYFYTTNIVEKWER